MIEEQSKTLSMISMLENLQLPGPPPGLAKRAQPLLIPQRFYVVQQWVRSKPKLGERAPGRVRMIGPRAEFGTQEFVVDLTGTQRARIIGQAIGFPLQGPGVYRCVVETKHRTKWKRVGATEFTVTYLSRRTH